MMTAEWNTAERFAASALAGRIMRLRSNTSRSNSAIADAILRDPLRVATASIDESAALAGVSAATVSRFARALDFEGYPELRAAIAAALQDVFNPVEKLRGALHRGAGGPHDEGTAAILSNVRTATDHPRVERITEAARLIVAARTVYVLGFGLSAHSAGHLSLGLQPFCAQLVNTVEFGGTETAAGRLMSVGPDDVLIAITVPRYARDAVRLANYARDRGATVIAITDSVSAPLASMAAITLTGPSTHPVLPSSSVAILAVIETLIAAVMTSSSANVARAQALTDAISAYLYPDASEG